MKFSELGKYLNNLEKTSSRIEITKILAELFNKATANEIDKIVNLTLGQLAPSYKSIIFNIAERMMVQAVSVAYKKDSEAVLKLFKQKGDMGEVVSGLARGTGTGLSVSDVYDRMVKIATEEGEGSVERKVNSIAKLLQDLDPVSAKFVTRIPIGRLRLGFSDKTILDALSWMIKGDKSDKEKIEKAYQVTPDVGSLAKKIKKLGVNKASKNSNPAYGIPILPMLAQRLKSPSDMIAKMDKVAVESKVDGLRIQIHFKKGSTPKTFTRNLNETSWMFPELGEISKFINAKEVILDTEAVGLDAESKKLANFQKTMSRRRKHNIGKAASEIPIKFYVFDILLKDGTGLMDKTYLSRRKVLEQTVKEGKLFKIMDYHLTKNPDEIARLNVQKHKEGLEGIMVKKVDSKYVPGRTGWRWVKMKEAEDAHAKLTDTIDCVVMGYTAGKGKRVSFGIGQFLAAVRDKDEYRTITKVGTGLTDEQFIELKKRLSKLEVKEKPKQYQVDKNLKPDFWVRPKLVVELAADEITKSPRHTAGFALRFPRLIKFRTDKFAVQATTLTEIKKLFKLQNN